MNSIGEKVDYFMKEYLHSNGENAAAFFVQKGTIQFKKKNFHPKGELFLFNPRYLTYQEPFNLDMYLPLSSDSDPYFEEATDENTLKVLQNLPYARRGYIFSNSVLKSYYEKMPWYVPNKDYVPKPDELQENEIKWLADLKKIKIKNIK